MLLAWCLCLSARIYLVSNLCPTHRFTCAVSDSDTMPDGPSVPDFTDKQKQNWTDRLKKIKEAGGGTFQYMGVGGWKTISPLYQRDSVAISLLVTSDGQLHCAEPGCKHTKFGESKFTRGEKQVNRHIASYHPPKKVTKGSAKGSSGGKQEVFCSSCAYRSAFYMYLIPSGMSQFIMPYIFC